MKTLVIRLSSIGDVLLTTPLVRCLRRAYPDATIDFCVFKEYAELVERNPNISNIISVDRLRPIAESKEHIRSRGIYDCVIDLHNNFRSRALRDGAGKNILVVNKRTFRRWLLVKMKINLLRNAPDVVGRYFETVKSLDVVNDGQGIDFNGYIGEQKKESLVGKDDANKFIAGLCPGAKHFTKRWLPERFAELALSIIREKNASVFLFGGKDDVELCDEIYKQVAAISQDSIKDFSGKFSLAGVAGVMQLCDVIVTNDSALMHVAASQKIPLVAVFGSTVKEFGFYPSSPNSLVVENNDLSCRPCTHIGRDTCPQGHFRCMVDIQVPTVEAAIDQITS